MSTNLQSETILALTTTIAELTEQARLFLECLEAERQAIINADTHAIDHLGAQKSDLAHALEELEAELKNTNKLAPNIDVTHWPAWNELLDVLRRAKTQNHLNGILVSQRLYFIRQALAAITGNEPNPTVYSKGGGQAVHLRGNTSIVV